MNLINRKSPEVVASSERSLCRFFVDIDHKRIHFTVAVCKFCNFTEGLYMQFLNDKSDWEFFTNGDTDGFKLVPCRTSFGVYNTGLTSMILKSMGFKDKKRLTIIKTGREIDGRPVYKFSNENVPTVLR